MALYMFTVMEEGKIKNGEVAASPFYYQIV